MWRNYTTEHRKQVLYYKIILGCCHTRDVASATSANGDDFKALRHRSSKFFAEEAVWHRDFGSYQHSILLWPPFSLKSSVWKCECGQPSCLLDCLNPLWMKMVGRKSAGSWATTAVTVWVFVFLSLCVSHVRNCSACGISTDQTAIPELATTSDG